MPRKNPKQTFEGNPHVGIVEIPEDHRQRAFLVLVDSENLEDMTDAILGFVWFSDPMELWDQEDDHITPFVRAIQVAAEKGYGPLLYESAFMFQAESENWIMPGTSTSKAARAVWKRFRRRKDVQNIDVWEGATTFDGETISRQWYPELDALYWYDAPPEEQEARARAVERGEDWFDEMVDKWSLSHREMLTLLFEDGSAFFASKVRN
jgi:hypothetical protein